MSSSSTVGQTSAAVDSYNPVFGTLVDGPDDLVGMIAYGRYKWAKREWIREEIARTGNRPKAAAFKTYAAHWTESQVGSLYETAEAALSEYTINILESETPRIEAQALKQAQSFWTDVWAGVVGAFAYTLLLVAFAIILRIAGIDILDVFDGAQTLKPDAPAIAQTKPS